MSICSDLKPRCSCRDRQGPANAVAFTFTKMRNFTNYHVMKAEGAGRRMWAPTYCGACDPRSIRLFRVLTLVLRSRIHFQLFVGHERRAVGCHDLSPLIALVHHLDRQKRSRRNRLETHPPIARILASYAGGLR